MGAGYLQSHRSDPQTRAPGGTDQQDIQHTDLTHARRSVYKLTLEINNA